MATSGQSTLRGIDIDKMAKGFADEENIFKNYVSVSTTSAREIRWYQKTAGFLTATSPANIDNVAPGARPFQLEQSWTRNTSYVRKYFVESPTLLDEDIKDSDVDILATNIRDLVRAVARQVDARIWDVLTESQSATNINSVTSTAAWDAASGQDIVSDIAEAKRKIWENNYNLSNGVLFISPKDEESLVEWLISDKGSSIPMFSSEKVVSGNITEFLGLRVVVSNNVTADYAVVCNPSVAVTWKSFMPITSRTMDDPGIGTKIRVWEEGEAILTDPKAVSLISNTQS